MNQPFVVKKIAVLGAGVMGAQIAAHCVNAGIQTYLFDLSGHAGHANALADKAIHALLKQTPTPLATPQTASFILARNYDEHLQELSDCELIIEAIGEKLEWKEALYQRISPYLNERAMLVSNTSGLSVNALASVLPEGLRAQFCGVHFFNPPRYMHLAELIPTHDTSPDLMNHLETWLTACLGKGVVRAKDTPNFIANRIGVFSLLATLRHAERLGLGLDEVDALTGTLLGRPKSATFRTMDVVGLDTMQHVVHTMQTALVDDPWHALFKLPDWMLELIAEGHLGQKSGQGVYRKKGKSIEVFDPRVKDYHESKAEVNSEVKRILLLKDALARQRALLESSQPQAQFLAACFRDLFHYCAYHIEGIADNVRDVDQAMRWGFGWESGPFETWQSFGVVEMTTAIEYAMHDECSLSQASLPAWLPPVDAFYDKTGAAFAPATRTFVEPRALPVYERQLAAVVVKKRQSETWYENEGVCLYRLSDDVGVLSFKSKANTIGQSVLDGLNEALSVAESRSQGLIIYQNDATNFSSGADLRAVAGLIQSNQMNALDTMLNAFQQVCSRLKYSAIPVVAALRGRALGGGCELMMHCDRVVAGFESYPGLVEAGVGLIPAGGGCKEWAMRAAQLSQGGEVMPLLRRYFEQTATGSVASSAPNAFERGFLQARDPWMMHAEEVLYGAVLTIKGMQALSYMPPMQARFKVGGREGHALLQTGLVNWLEGGFISAHDYFLANQLAEVMCGGDVDQGTLVDEAWMHRLEREAFMRLAETPLTQARIQALLETGKPLRN